MELVRQTARKIEAGGSDQWLWKGRRVSRVDGSTSSMPDTSENQRAFPQANTQKIGLGFPVMRYVVLISLATGVVRDLALGPYKGKETGETALFRTLLDGLESGEIVLGDRCFASYFMLAELLLRGVDGLFRMHQRRKFDFRGGRQLGFEDHVATWTKPARPEWMDEETDAQIPNTMEIRELRFKVQRPGFRVQELVLVTTMLDAEESTCSSVSEMGRHDSKCNFRQTASRLTGHVCLAICPTYPALVNSHKRRCDLLSAPGAGGLIVQFAGSWHGCLRANRYHPGPQARHLPTASRSSCP